MQQQALSAIVAWVRLDRAIDAFNAELRKRYGITGLQLAVLRMVAERGIASLTALKRSLVMHPATLGQAIDELRAMGLCIVEKSPRDRRARMVLLSPKGKELLGQAPVAGPVRLRAVDQDPQRLDRLAAAFEDAIDLFGLGAWDPGAKTKVQMEEDRV
jgi:DNA-binding MarR family transcriptional regulator